MTTSDVQKEFESKFHEAVDRRNALRDAIRDATAMVPRLKADEAQARADIAKLRADAKAAGVKLPKIAANDGDDQAA